jgi:DNA-directed RNA polymerase II subunit RPB4
MKRKSLFPFEIASMANLFPGSAEEARTLIPSLADKLEDSEIQEILDDMKAYESKYVFESK